MTFKITRQGQNVAESNAWVRTRSGGYQQTSTPLVNSQGQYNSNDKAGLRELLATMGQMLNEGQMERTAQADDGATARLIEAALQDPGLRGGAFERLGEVFADSLSETLGRMAFTDKILARVDTPEKGTPRVFINQHDVQAWHMTSAGAVRESVPRPKFIYPEEFWLIANVLIDESDLWYAGQTYLETKYNDALVATMVREDNVTKFLLDQASTLQNNNVSFGAFTPTVFGTLRDQVWGWGLQPATCLLAVDLQNDILADTDWHGVYSPVEQHMLFEEGKFGEIFGVEVFTDGYRYDTLRCLEAGEVYMLASPATLGAKLPLVKMYSHPIDKHAVDGSPRKGWWIGQSECIVIGNARGVSKGTKL
jgi:hypothetical protein